MIFEYFNVASNVIISVSYFTLTSLLLYVVWMSKSFYLFRSGSATKRKFIILINLLQIMFAFFIALCGIAHAINAIEFFHFGTSSIVTGKCIALFLCALISLTTAIYGIILFPFILTAMKNLELTDEGTLRLIDAIEKLQKSIIILSSDFHILKGNSMTEVYFGANYVGCMILDLIGDDEGKVEISEALQSMSLNSYTGETMAIEHKIKRKNDNKELWVESTIRKNAMASAEGTISFEFMIVTRNIDVKKKSELFKKLLEESRIQENINQSKLLYITSVAHDLKTPLQTFCFGLELLLKTSMTVQQREILEQVTVASEMMKLAIFQSIDIGKALGGRLVTPRKTSFQLSEILGQVKIIMKNYSATVPIYYSLSPDITDNIITDREWLWQMLLNLLTNACKYTVEGSIQVAIYPVNNSKTKDVEENWDIGMNTEASNTDSMLYFEVTDTGVGISDDKKITIFDAFNQAQIGQLTGTGLGLYGLRCRVEALNGACGVHDNRNDNGTCGSIFWFKIPYVRDISTSISEVYIERPLMHQNSGNSIILKESETLSPRLNNYDRRTLSSSSSIIYSKINPSLMNTAIDTTIDNNPTISSAVPYFGTLFSSSNTRGSQYEVITSTNENISTTTITNNPLCNNKISPDFADFPIVKFVSSKKKLQLVNVDDKYHIVGSESKQNLSIPRSKSFTFLDDINGNHSIPPTLSSLKTYSVPIKILLIDDSLTILKMTSMALRNLGYLEIDCFENGLTGLQAMKQSYVDIVFTDVQMPILTGPEMALRFREYESKLFASGARKKRQTIIAITANRSDELRGLVPEVFDYICTKPIDITELKNIMKKFCRRMGTDDMV